MTRPTFDSGFTTAAMSHIFSPASTIGALLEFEAALALALADAGVAPSEEAGAVAAACGGAIGAPEAILDTWWSVGTPIIALRRAVTERIESETARDWFHFGATTQDACDTAASLLGRAGIDAIHTDLSSIARCLRELTITHRDQPQIGRTFLQDALATTFGFRTAMWLDAVLDDLEDLHRERQALSIQLGGPNGTRSHYGPAGPDVVTALAQRLQLSAGTTWHAHRSRVLRLAQTLERLSATMAKIATDVAILSSGDIGEIVVRTGGSSAMAGKANPIDSVRAIAASAACTGAVAMLTAAPPVELDRGVGGWHVEWIALPLAFHTAGAAVGAMTGCLASLEVHSETMTTRVGRQSDAGVPAGIGAQIDAVLARSADWRDQSPR